MTFAEALQNYMNDLGCTQAELAAASGISEMSIRRYLLGERVPPFDGSTVTKLAHGIYALSKKKDLHDIGETVIEEKALHDIGETVIEEKALPDTDESAILDTLKSAARGFPGDYDTLLAKLNILFTELGIPRNDLSRHLGYDPSYISRILSGSRRPADIPAFMTGIASYTARRCADSPKLLSLLGSESFSSESECREAILNWLFSGSVPPAEQEGISHFLSVIDRFDLNEYIRAIRFDEMKVPTAPFQIHASRWCSGLDEMMEAELDFLKSTVLSRSKQDVIMYSDMPMEEMSKDPEFPKKWMFGMAMLLKKGLKLQMIHNIDRPLYEMILGLEAFIPMYMTGQIEPFYLERPQGGVFLHFLRSSGAAAVGGEAIAGNQAEGRYYFSRKESDVKYYRKRAESLLSKAKPLMKIFLKARSREFLKLMENQSQIPGTRRYLLYAPPLWIMSGELLDRILSRSCADPDLAEQILSLYRKRRHDILKILSENKVILEYPALGPDEFSSFPALLDLTGSFAEKNIVLDYEDYKRLLSESEAFAKEHENLILQETAASPFRNICIQILSDRHVIISKATAPSIVFLITHPNMVNAFDKFIVPINELE